MSFVSKTLSPAESKMRERLQRQLIAEDQKFGNQWKHNGGSLERWCKRLYYVFAAYSLVVYFMNELILLAANSAAEGVISADRLLFFSHNGWFVHGLILLTVAAFVLQLCRQFVPCLCVQGTITLVSVLQLLQVINGQYVNATLLAVLYAITFGGILCLSGIVIIRVCDQRRLQRAVEQEYQKIYYRYRNEDDTLFSSEQLSDIVDAYETALANGEDPPKAI